MGNNKSNNSSDFMHYCYTGDLENAKRIYSVGGIANVYLNFAFKDACEKGYLEMAKWLHTIGNYDTRNYHLSFRLSCEMGHLNVAKWLCSLKIIKLPKNIVFVKYLASKNGHIDVCIWLDSIDINIVTYIENKEFTKIITFLNIKKEQHDLTDIGCPICFEQTPSLTIKTECKHIFCINCIHTIEKSKNTCPICRVNINYASYCLHLNAPKFT